MTGVIIAMGFCAVSSIILFDQSDKFTVDDSPIGSMMLAASILLAVAAVFFAGMVTAYIVLTGA